MSSDLAAYFLIMRALLSAALSQPVISRWPADGQQMVSSWYSWYSSWYSTAVSRARAHCAGEAAKCWLVALDWSRYVAQDTDNAAGHRCCLFIGLLGLFLLGGR